MCVTDCLALCVRVCSVRTVTEDCGVRRQARMCSGGFQYIHDDVVVSLRMDGWECRWMDRLYLSLYRINPRKTL